MKPEDLKALDKWWEDQGCSKETDPEYKTAKAAWTAAIAYEQNKTVRTYRWNGVIQ